MANQQMLDRLEAAVEDACLSSIDSKLWERIQNMEAGQNEYGYDPFGFEPEFLKYVIPLAKWVYDEYFRTEVYGIDNIPDEGPVLLVANHTGQIPIDGFLIGAACLFEREPPRMLRGMVERWFPTLPVVSWLFARIGQVVGTRENCRILLRRGGCIGVFPEGAKGINKTYDHAYELETFGYGFMRLALEHDTPIVPIGVVGGEEQYPSIWNVETLADLLGMPAFPVTPTWPLLGPIGLVPLPVKYSFHFGEPMQFDGAPDAEDRVIQPKVREVRQAVHQLIQTGLEKRKGVFW